MGFRRKVIRGVLGLFVLVVGFGSVQAAPPDSVYINARVITVDAKFSAAEAFAVSGGRFVAVGSNSAIKKLTGPNTAIVDLKGRTVLPGLIDAHPHVLTRRYEEMRRPSLHDVHSVAEIMQRVGGEAAVAPPGAWIVTGYIGQSPDYFNLPDELAEKRWPTRLDLDKAAPRNPVYIPGSNKWPHPSIFNSAALALLGVTRATPNEPRVLIAHDETGEPTGVIYGLNFFNHASPLWQKLVSIVPPLTDDARLAAVTRAVRDNAERGVTGIYEAHSNSPTSVQAFRKLKASGMLINRAVFAAEVPPDRTLDEIDRWMGEQTEAKGAGSGDDLLKVLGVTITIDGATQFGEALMNEPYLDPYGRMGNGKQEVSLEKLVEIGRLALKNDLRLNIVAAGNKACDIAVEALETVNRQKSLRDKGWVVQHFQHPTREEIARLHEMGILATTYSSVDFSKGAETYIRRFPGLNLWKTVVPLRWWWDGEVTIAQSTDGAHYDPMFTIWEALVRLDGRTGESLLTPEKTITREEAIRMYTINGARIMQWADRIGSIEAGKYADFVVVDRDILTVPVEQIRDAKVLLTVLGGKPVYGKTPI